MTEKTGCQIDQGQDAQRSISRTIRERKMNSEKINVECPHTKLSRRRKTSSFDEPPLPLRPNTVFPHLPPSTLLCPFRAPVPHLGPRSTVVPPSTLELHHYVKLGRRICLTRREY